MISEGAGQVKHDVTKERPEWVYSSSGTTNVLHRVRRRSSICASATSRAWWKRWFIDTLPNPVLEMACGRMLRVSAPGIFSRMGAPRCRACCRALRITAGDGCPINDETCKRIPR